MNPRRLIRAGLAAACLAAAAAPGTASGAAGQVFSHPEGKGPLSERLAWAAGEAGKLGLNRGYWVGYGIKRLMGERSQIGWYSGRETGSRLTLDDLINGRKSPLERRVAEDQAARGTAAALRRDPSAPSAAETVSRRGRSERLVWKEIAILFRLPASGAAFPPDFRVSNLSGLFEFDELPFFWLGPADDAESLAYLIPLYGRAATEDDKRSALWAIGLHRNAASVVPFVEKILAGKDSEEIRSEAASCLGEQDDKRALDLLLKLVRTDPSRRLRESAVRGIAELRLPEAETALIGLATASADREIRKEAVQGLADRAGPEAVKTLEKIATSDKDGEVQLEAVQAFEDLPDRSGLSFLIGLARTHADSRVRTEAVESIGDIGGPQAVKALIELVRRKGS